MATHTAPRDWWDEPTEVIATVVDILETAAAAGREGGRRGR